MLQKISRQKNNRNNGSIVTSITALVILAVCAGIGILIYQFALQKESSSTRNRKIAVPVLASAMKREKISQISRYSGALKANARFTVSPKVSGRLIDLLVDTGSLVKSGDVVAILDDEEYVQSLEQAQAALKVSIANAETAKVTRDEAGKDLERVSRLVERDVASASEYDTAKAKYDSCVATLAMNEAQIAQDKVAVEIAKTRLEYTKVKAEWSMQDASGKPVSEIRTVGEKFVVSGDLLKANDPIITVLEVNPMTAFFHTGSIDYPRIKKDMPVDLQVDSYPGRIFPGNVFKIAPQLDELSRQAEIEILIPNDENLLKPGMYVDIYIKFAEKEQALVAPLAALAVRTIDDTEKTGLFLVQKSPVAADKISTADIKASSNDSQDNYSVAFIPIQVGIRQGERVEILADANTTSLLEHGEVVTRGHNLLEEGTEILLPMTEKKPLPASTTPAVDKNNPESQQSASQNKVVVNVLSSQQNNQGIITIAQADSVQTGIIAYNDQIKTDPIRIDSEKLPNLAVSSNLHEERSAQ